MLRPHCNPECIEAGTPFHSVFTVVHIATRIDGQTQLRENKKSVRIFYFKGDRPGKCPHATSDCGVEQIHTVNINHADSSYNYNLFLKLERPGFFLVPPPPLYQMSILAGFATLLLFPGFAIAQIYAPACTMTVWNWV